MYLADMFAALNRLNLILRGNDSNIFNDASAIKSFVEKLELRRLRVNEGDSDNFPKLSEHDLYSKLCLKETIDEHLRSLQSEFERYFPELKFCETRFIRRPFDCSLDEIPSELQDLQRGPVRWSH